MPFLPLSYGPTISVICVKEHSKEGDGKSTKSLGQTQTFSNWIKIFGVTGISPNAKVAWSYRKQSDAMGMRVG